MSTYFSILSLLLILSCGKAVKNESENQEEQSDSQDGLYVGLLVPVNDKISNHVQGDVRVSKFSDEFKVEVRLKGAPQGTFVQGLHTGTRCPRIDHDLNFDGYIDHTETKEFIGNMIVPFDGDLSSQSEGQGLRLSGNYSYKRVTSYYLLLSDLRHNKFNGNDLPLERRVVGIYLKNKNLPSTVTGGDVLIACGVLTRISTEESSTQDRWSEDDNQRDSNTHRSPRRPRRPAPAPEPEIEVDPAPETVPHWWDRWRDRFRRWREGWSESSDRTEVSEQ